MISEDRILGNNIFPLQTLNFKLEDIMGAL